MARRSTDTPSRPRRLAGLSLLWALCWAGWLGTPDVASAQAAICQPLPVDEVREMLEEAESRIALLDYNAALSTLTRLQTQLPCAQGVVGRDQLISLHIFKGVTWYFLEKEEGSVQAFSNALTIDPGYYWDEGLGERPRALFDKADAAAATRTPEAIEVPALAEGAMVAVDGSQVVPGEVLHLLPGEHLLQFRPADAPWGGRYFTVTAGAPNLPVPASLLRPAPEPTPQPAPTDEPQPETRPTPSGPNPALVQAGIWGGAAVTTAGGLTWVIGGTRYLADRRLILETYYADETDPDLIAERDAALEHNARLARISNTGLALTVVGAGVTTFSLWLSSRNDAPVTATPWVAPGAGGLLLSGRF